jgi:NAD(P)-dependent dehydrogenase (short-subunit alcohol dehydrogenase family)
MSAFLILGGSGGIGSAVVRQLVAADHQVAIAGRNAATLETVGDETGARVFEVDATDVLAVERVATQAKATLGGLYGIANCVGSILLKPAHLTKPDEWDGVVATNLTSAFAAVRAAGKVMRDGTGSIVLVSTGAARLGLPNHEAIAAAKAGVIGLARSAAATYAPRLRVNVVAPGLVRTPLSERITGSAAALKASVAMHPLGRIGEPEDVARAICWLLDPAQDWVTGQVLGVDGGLADLKR